MRLYVYIILSYTFTYISVYMWLVRIHNTFLYIYIYWCVCVAVRIHNTFIFVNTLTSFFAAIMTYCRTVDTKGRKVNMIEVYTKRIRTHTHTHKYEPTLSHTHNRDERDATPHHDSTKDVSRFMYCAPTKIAPGKNRIVSRRVSHGSDRLQSHGTLPLPHTHTHTHTKFSLRGDCCEWRWAGWMRAKRW